MTTTYRDLLAGVAAAGTFSWRGSDTRDVAAEARGHGWLVLPLDTRETASVDAVYAQLERSWQLPSWFGRNLDALYDCLGELAVVPTIVIWDGLRDLAAWQPMFAADLLDVLRDAVETAESLSVIVRDDLGVSGFDALL